MPRALSILELCRFRDLLIGQQVEHVRNAQRLREAATKTRQASEWHDIQSKDLAADILGIRAEIEAAEGDDGDETAG